jgi:hypothetical protein
MLAIPGRAACVPGMGVPYPAWVGRASWWVGTKTGSGALKPGTWRKQKGKMQTSFGF